MSIPLRLLILEDQADAAELSVHALRRAGFAPDWLRVETEAEYLAALDPALDLIVADHYLPQFDALRALELLQERELDIPFIIVSGTIDEELAVEAMVRGASDYLLKDRLVRLGQAVTRALERRSLRHAARAAESALRESEARYRSLVERVPAVIFMIAVGEAAPALYISPQVEDLLGYPIAEWMADPDVWFKLLHPDDAPWVRQEHRHTRAALEPFSAEYRLIARDGHPVWVRSESVLIRDDDGRPLFWQGLMSDISERKQAEERIEQHVQRLTVLRAEAESALQARDEFLSVAAHELNSPLTSLKGHTQFMLHRFANDDTLDRRVVESSLRTLDQQADKMSRLVAQLVDVSRIQQYQLMLDRRPTDLARLVARVVEAVAVRTNHKYPFRVQAATGVRAVVDPMRVEQVVHNLLDNAIKFNPDRQPTDVEVSGPATGVVRLVVRDRGLGIPPEQRDRIFERFYRAHADDYRSGLGLSLYISRLIVELHGGELAAEFPSAGGTCFVMTLPVGDTDGSTTAS